MNNIEKSGPVNKESVNKKSKNIESTVQARNDIEEELFDSECFSKMLDTEFATQTSDIEMSVDSGEIPLPLTTNANKEEVFRFYWWDAYEDPYKQPGVVYLFGKVFVPSTKTYCSCCLTVKNVPRRIYLLPRVHV